MKEYDWEYESNSSFGAPAWCLRDDKGAAMGWVDAVSGGWSIYDVGSGTEPQVFKDAEEAKAVCMVLMRMEGEFE